VSVDDLFFMIFTHYNNKVPKSNDDTGPVICFVCFVCVYICDKLLLDFSEEVVFVQYTLLITVIFSLRDILMPYCVHNATHNLTSILHCRFAICLKT